VQTGTLGVNLGLGTLGLGFLLGDAGPLFGLGGLALATISLGTVLSGYLLTTVLKFAFALLNPSVRTHAWKHEDEQSNDDQGHDNDGDNGAGGHRVPPFDYLNGVIREAARVGFDETAPTFDLQSHSTHSDGSLAPAEVVARAANAGVALLALTDHDSVDGVPEALAAAGVKSIEVIPATEMSAVHDSHEDLHILGYAIDHTDGTLLEALEDFRADRVRRIFAMADRLRELGFELDDASFKDHPAPGRPHLADALLAHPANAQRLREEGIDGKNALFPAYLVPGAPGYVRRSRPTVTQAIDVIHAAGGLAVWAHPYWDLDEPLDTLRAFAGYGIDGVEAFYPTFSAEQTAALHTTARELGLLTTGSTDFHGPAHERFNRFRGFQLYGLEPDLGRLTP
jgi:predicted metal-dependent phosphoesterase TrpH